MVGLADLDSGGPHGCAVAEEAESETGDVGDDEIVRDIAEDPPDPLKTCADLVDPGFDGDVEGLDGLGARLTVGVEVVPLSPCAAMSSRERMES